MDDRIIHFHDFHPALFGAPAGLTFAEAKERQRRHEEIRESIRQAVEKALSKAMQATRAE
jgi:hypothetical protein